MEDLKIDIICVFVGLKHKHPLKLTLTRALTSALTLVLTLTLTPTPSLTPTVDIFTNWKGYTICRRRFVVGIKVPRPLGGIILAFEHIASCGIRIGLGLPLRFGLADSLVALKI